MMNVFFQKENNNEKGTTLLELVVAIGIFIILTILVNGIYVNIITAQKQTVAAQLTQESLRFVFEMMSKEIRTAQGLNNGSDCASTTPLVIPSSSSTPPVYGYYKIFNNINNNAATNTSALYFKNKEGECVVYDLFDNMVRIRRGTSTSNIKIGYITPDELKITDLKFAINDGRDNVVREFQSNVTILIDAEMKKSSIQKIKMQTTVSSREYSYWD